MDLSKRIFRLLFIGLLVTFLLVPTVLAGEQGSIIFNGQECEADFYVEEGVSYISVASLIEITGLNVEHEGYVPLRQFFENQGGVVDWDHVQKKIIISFGEEKDEPSDIERKDGWTADELIAESTRLQQELNTFKMNGSFIMNMAISGLDEVELPETFEMTTTMEGVFQQEPLSMHMKQIIGLPTEGLSEEELAILGETGGIETEMVWKDNAIYQKLPLTDQWIVQELDELGMMEEINKMLQLTPQQSMEMMREYGINNVFGEDISIDGQDYYTVKSNVDKESFKKLAEELLGDMNLSQMLIGTLEMPELSEEDMTQAAAEMQQMVDQLLSSMELEYYVESFINKETLLTEKMSIDMNIKFDLDETIIPEGPVTLEMKMVGDFEVYDFGEEIQLPDLSNAITQQEYMEQIISEMDQMELIEETEEVEEIEEEVEVTEE